MTKSKYGVIRKSKEGKTKGYVDMGLNYFGIDEIDIINNYVDLGFKIKSNKYLIVGGDSIVYIYKYRTELGEKIEERVEEVEHPTMMMVTELKAK
tara:strand:+ start:1772 stop:2056 length:285 start_codon:yes stop_codon:yes gene_type:complete